MIDETVKLQVSNLVSSWKPNAEIAELQTITPDVSKRRYYRAILSDSEVESVVAMIFDSTEAAETGSGEQVSADQAFVALAEYFKKNNIPVPKIYLCNFNSAHYLLEDLGDVQLFDVLSSGENTGKFYKLAIDELVKLQQLRVDEQVLCYRRSFTEELISSEIDEFFDYSLPSSLKNSKEVADSRNVLVKQIVSDFMAQPYVLSHRDYHSWNVLIEGGQKIRIIDFQDSLLAPYSYDLASLLNDRDTDASLGNHLYDELFAYYLSKQAHYFKGIEPKKIAEGYLITLLQRDLKVSGRFNKIAKERSMLEYLKWVPGTNQRIGSVLSSLSEVSDIYRDTLDFFSSFIPEVSEGRKNSLLSKFM